MRPCRPTQLHDGPVDPYLALLVMQLILRVEDVALSCHCGIHVAEHPLIVDFRGLARCMAWSLAQCVAHPKAWCAA